MPSPYPGTVEIKSGQNICVGDIFGALPDVGECTPLPTEERTWGEIKSDYSE